MGNYRSMRTARHIKKCAQVVSVILNMVFFVIGTMILSVGAYLQATNNTITILTREVQVISGAIALLLTGSITIIVAFAGILGSLWLKRRFLVPYFVLMLLVVGIEVVLGSLAYTFRTGLNNHLDESIKSAIVNYNTSNEHSNNDIIDIFQQGFSCCGYNNPNDWSNASSVPKTCHCQNTTVLTTCNTTIPAYPKLYVWNTGCKEAILDTATKYSTTLAVAVILFAGFQVIGALLAICICLCITRDKKQHMDLISPI